MNITVLAVGTKMPQWVEEAAQEYSKRLKREFNFQLKEIKPEKRTGISAELCMLSEEERIRSAIPNQSYLIILDERGLAPTSTELSSYLKKWKETGINPCFVIGGADGI